MADNPEPFEPGTAASRAARTSDPTGASGVPQSAAGSPPPAETGTAPDPRYETQLWQGRASWKALYPHLLVWLLVTLVLTIGVGVISSWKSYTWWALLLCGLYLAWVLLRHVYIVLATSYRLTSQRLFIRRGILTQTVDQTELMRVDDVRVRQTLIERILGIGQVEVVASDRSDAAVRIRHIEDPEAVAEHVRRHTRLLQRRTLFMESLS